MVATTLALPSVPSNSTQRWHTLVLLKQSGRVYACGRGYSGQLGTGSREQCTMPKAVRGVWSGGQGTPVDSGDCRVRLLAAGEEASFAVLADDKVRGSYCSIGLLFVVSRR